MRKAEKKENEVHQETRVMKQNGENTTGKETLIVIKHDWNYFSFEVGSVTRFWIIIILPAIDSFLNGLSFEK